MRHVVELGGGPRRLEVGDRREGVDAHGRDVHQNEHLRSVAGRVLREVVERDPRAAYGRSDARLGGLSRAHAAAGTPEVRPRTFAAVGSVGACAQPLQQLLALAGRPELLLAHHLRRRRRSTRNGAGRAGSGARGQRDTHLVVGRLRHDAVIAEARRRIECLQRPVERDGTATQRR